MKTKHTLSIFMCIFFCYCEPKKIRTKTNSTPPSTEGVVINPALVQRPEIIPAGKPKTIQIPASVEYTVGVATIQQPHGHFNNYNTEQGLALSAIICSYYDKRGNLWFGTQGGGVSKYDGHSFTNFTTRHGLGYNSFVQIIEDKKGNLWFGTEGGGISKYDGRSFTQFNSKHGLTINPIISFAEDKNGNLWFGGKEGAVTKFDGKTFSNLGAVQKFTNNTISSLVEDKNGNMWFGTRGNGIIRYDGKSYTSYGVKQGLANDVVFSMFSDKTGIIWIGTGGGGVSRYDGTSFTNFTTAQGLPDNFILTIAQTADGDIWFGTYKGGVSRFDGKTFSNFTTSQGLADGPVKSIVEDKNGNIWFGTYGGGVSKYCGSAFSHFDTDQGFENDIVLSLMEDKAGNIWIGTYGGGVSKYDGHTFTKFTTDQGLAGNTVFCMSRDKTGNVWLGTYGKGLSKYDGKSFTTFTDKQGLASNFIFSTLCDRRGNLWIGTYGKGVSKYDGKSFTNMSCRQGLADSVVQTILEDRNGNIWFGTQTGGISKYDGSRITNFSTDQGLPSKAVTSLIEDKNGKLWIATENGLCRMSVVESHTEKKMAGTRLNDNSKKLNYHLENYTTANGLPDNFITQVLQLPNGKIVVGTNIGIAIFNPDLPLDTNGKLPGLELFNSSTGYPIKDINSGQNTMYLDSKGMIWAGTGDEKVRLLRFDYAAVKRIGDAPKAVIERIKIGEQPVCYYTLAPDADSNALALHELLTYNKVLTEEERDSVHHKFNGIVFSDISAFYPVPGNLVLPYEHNSVTIDYNVVEVGRHFMVNYQYMLQGCDKDWSPVLKKQEATYVNIDEGTYTFKLRAQSPDGVWSEITTYTFTILPPWWRTWWMYLIYALLGIAFINLIVWWNGRTLKARADFLASEVKKATAVIVKQKDIVEEQKKVVEEQKKIVEEKHKEITDSINYAERIQKALLASKKMLDENLRDYFVLFKPKDVVSGDFYWATKLNNQHFILVTADSTGHGVPGAIMSILNISCLEKAVEVEKLSAPNEILNHTRLKIIETLKRDGSSEGGKDGMDASLLCFDFKNNRLSCASANNPVWIIRQTEGLTGQHELIEIKGDKMPVGKHEKDQLPFTLHTLALQRGDVVYTLTDGYPDQFGGEKGKKFMNKRLQELVLSLAHEPMAVQHQKLNNAFDTWKRNLEQVDDVCLIGVRV